MLFQVWWLLKEPLLFICKCNHATKDDDIREEETDLFEDLDDDLYNADTHKNEQAGLIRAH